MDGEISCTEGCVRRKCGRDIEQPPGFKLSGKATGFDHVKIAMFLAVVLCGPLTVIHTLADIHLRFTYGEAVFLTAVCRSLRNCHFILKMYKPCGIVCPKREVTYTRDGQKIRS